MTLYVVVNKDRAEGDPIYLITDVYDENAEIFVSAEDQAGLVDELTRISHDYTDQMFTVSSTLADFEFHQFKDKLKQAIQIGDEPYDLTSPFLGKVINVMDTRNPIAWIEFVDNVTGVEKHPVRTPAPRKAWTLRTKLDPPYYEIVPNDSTKVSLHAATKAHRARAGMSQLPPHHSHSYYHPQEPEFPVSEFNPGRYHPEGVTGVRFKPDGVKVNRYMLADNNTYARPYDFDTKEQAESYVKRLFSEIDSIPGNKSLHPRDKALHLWASDFSDLVERSKKLQAMRHSLLANGDYSWNNRPRHNEVLARTEWKCDGTSQVTIYGKDLESRLLAQIRALDLQQHLANNKEKYQQPPYNYQPGYQVPISFFDHDKDKLLPYDTTAQQADLDLNLEEYFQANARLTKDEFASCCKYQVYIHFLKGEPLPPRLKETYIFLRSQGYINVLTANHRYDENRKCDSGTYLKNMDKILAADFEVMSGKTYDNATLDDYLPLGAHLKLLEQIQALEVNRNSVEIRALTSHINYIFDVISTNKDFLTAVLLSRSDERYFGREIMARILHLDDETITDKLFCNIKTLSADAIETILTQPENDSLLFHCRNEKSMKRLLKLASDNNIPIAAMLGDKPNFNTEKKEALKVLLSETVAQNDNAALMKLIGPKPDGANLMNQVLFEMPSDVRHSVLNKAMALDEADIKKILVTNSGLYMLLRESLMRRKWVDDTFLNLLNKLSLESRIDVIMNVKLQNILNYQEKMADFLFKAVVELSNNPSLVKNKDTTLAKIYNSLLVHDIYNPIEIKYAKSIIELAKSLSEEDKLKYYSHDKIAAILQSARLDWYRTKEGLTYLLSPYDDKCPDEKADLLIQIKNSFDTHRTPLTTQRSSELNGILLQQLLDFDNAHDNRYLQRLVEKPPEGANLFYECFTKRNNHIATQLLPRVNTLDANLLKNLLAEDGLSRIMTLCQKSDGLGISGFKQVLAIVAKIEPQDRLQMLAAAKASCPKGHKEYLEAISIEQKIAEIENKYKNRESNDASLAHQVIRDIYLKDSEHLSYFKTRGRTRIVAFQQALKQSDVTSMITTLCENAVDEKSHGYYVIHAIARLYNIELEKSYEAGNKVILKVKQSDSDISQAGPSSKPSSGFTKNKK